jgi:carbamoyl-phosphate synthase large subunit
MKPPLKMILTAVGCPGASTLINMLRRNGERKIEIIGVDMDGEASGRFMVDKFYKIPPGNSPNYISEMIRIAEKEGVAILFPESSNEVFPLACNKKEFEKLGVKVVVSDPEPIAIANNKYRMYEILRRKTNIPLPRYYSVTTLDEFNKAITELEYPEKPVIFKPHIGKGSRGVRIIDPDINRIDILMNYKPNDKYMSLRTFNEIFEESEIFPQLLVMEYLPGLEYTTDSISLRGRELFTTIKTVEQARWGVIVKGELVRRQDLVDQTRKILKVIPLSYCSNFQFIDDRVIEINPRVSTFIYQNNLIPPYIAIKLALGEITEDDVMAYRTKIRYGIRMVRYMDQIFFEMKKDV